MGNDHSHLSGVEIEEKSVEVSDFWSHHSATIINSENTTNLSVLTGELFVDGPLWKTQTPLEKNSKHLMIYRHPCILRYISSWQKSSKYYLAVEEVVPLSHVLATQNALQICIGLHSILKALCFLHEKASISHNNICTAAIYASKEGSWKLGGMEYVCKFNELSSDFLKKTRNSRYNKAIDPNEDKHIQGPRRDFIDIFAFGVLVCEVLKSKDEEIPGLTSFKELCKNDLQNIDVALRPKLSSLLDHEFFNHEFIVIHSFLAELPLKSDEEKMQFFHSLAERLKAFPEVIVAKQLGNLLLSRLVLLNKTAQEELLPFILRLRVESEDNTGNIFTEDVFRKFLTPKLLEIFGVRDAQIRLLLLNNFKHFVHTFTKEELQSCILPELLVGVKDTNDHLVSVTLRTLADLVPILGAATVIGGRRGKLFTDGRPVSHPNRRTSRRNSKKIEPVIPPDTNPIIQTNQVIMDLPERPRPDGEEGETSTEEAEQSVEEDLDNWEDWGESNPQEIVESVESNSSESVTSVFERENVAQKKLPDILELDIKNQTSSGGNDDFDFFQDMEPVIETSAKFVIEEESASKLKLGVKEDGNEDGWVDEDW
ncbi:protein-associating with the carboxyl-terminal domain of ezrin [Tribolium castaneum]|uniref:Protein-associating with the carboxyl-terminal domain of ezrin-like Protein n=1 Tax=Tribolium castaneum TaxID=7070 RepID=D6X3F4_TRICA|nr:PREDICTED: protein-associating with the carboxyl-terminal domain of ezrin [Tribolium castaneum]EEZ97411.1 Protein-associating with the carboxyl-terminal domain of ezrin-like Protein [Tribolium castaneum]|eukprot:XP_971893.1 PREDICTED: protein-associating with the carboxyl-terminal domain of ezrin [Tribolium castaneum]